MLRQRREWKLGRGYVFMVAEREHPSTFIGKIALSGIMRGAMYGAYLGYWMSSDTQGRGYVTEALGAVLDFAFGPAGLHRVQAAIMPRNARSLRVIEKLGVSARGLRRAIPADCRQMGGPRPLRADARGARPGRRVRCSTG